MLQRNSDETLLLRHTIMLLNGIGSFIGPSIGTQRKWPDVYIYLQQVGEQHHRKSGYSLAFTRVLSSQSPFFTLSHISRRVRPAHSKSSSVR